MSEPRFCEKCGQKLPDDTLINKISGKKFHQFSDGFYCEPCAKIKVEKARK